MPFHGTTFTVNGMAVILSLSQIGERKLHKAPIGGGGGGGFQVFEKEKKTNQCHR